MNDLCGVPVVFDGNISTKGMLTACGSRILDNYIPIFDAEVVSRLYAAGAACVGKASVSEFGMGGCSGGAKAVAEGQAVCAIGIDTGGALRQSAAREGLIGLRPTYGAISRYGAVAFASSFDAVGITANTAYDCAVVFDAISGCDDKDMTSAAHEHKSTCVGIDSDIKSLRIGVIDKMFSEASPGAEKAVREALKRLESLVAEIVPIDIDQLELQLPVYYIISCAEAASNLARYTGVTFGRRASGFNSSTEAILKTRSEGFGDEAKRRILFGNYVLKSANYETYFMKAQSLRAAIKRSFASALENIDIIATPTTKAAEAGEAGNPAIEQDFFTVTASLCGLPALSMPAGTENGLPVGMQLMGRPFEEGVLLRAAHNMLKQTGGGSNGN